MKQQTTDRASLLKGASMLCLAIAFGPRRSAGISDSNQTLKRSTHDPTIATQRGRAGS